MSKSEALETCCPRCRIPMLIGRLKGPVNVVHVESLHSLEHCSLQAWICPACGYVELKASRPQDLARNDVPDEDLGVGRGDWREDF
jgi:hypothetical protein